MDDAEAAGREYTELVRIMDRLRSENGCPWDRKQTVKSLINYFLEEAFEVVDAVWAENSQSVAEELGDMLMEVVFLARLYKEKQSFTMSDVIAGINRKMIKRHPHVFGDAKVGGADDVMMSWTENKNREKARTSLFDGISRSSPALLTAFQIGLRGSQVGFDWPHADAVLEKVKEEIAELENAIGKESQSDKLEELGDAFFALANLSRHLGINPELALRRANDKFRARFRFIEGKLSERDKNVRRSSLEELETLWEASKDFERKGKK